MKYLRAIISSDSQGNLYKKDFRVEKVFSTIVRVFVDSLINKGWIIVGDKYDAEIIPRYGPFAKQPDDVQNSEKEILSKSTWLVLKYEGPVQPDKPVDYFTIEVIVERNEQRRFRCIANFEVDVLEYFWKTIELPLIQRGVLSKRESRHHRLYARDDDTANFDREELSAWEREAAKLVQFEESEEVSSTSPIPQKSFQDFTIRAVKKLVRGKLADDILVETDEPARGHPTEEMISDELSEQPKVHIFITRQALESLQQIARSGVRDEQGGVLVGLVFEDTNTHDYLVRIDGHIAAEGALANAVELRFTYESWHHQRILQKELFPEKRIIGWYHTHLDLVKKTFMTTDPRQNTYSTPLYFSKDDLFTHREFFREKWYVAMVLDPEGNLTFFQWIGDEIGECLKFYVIDADHTNVDKIDEVKINVDKEE